MDNKHDRPEPIELLSLKHDAKADEFENIPTRDTGDD